MSLSLATTAESILTIKAELDFRTAAGDFPDAAFRRFGQVSATRLPALPEAAPYNKARGLSLDDRLRLDDITAFYAETRQRPRLEVWAGDDSPELRNCLGGQGLLSTAGAVTLHARPRATAPGLPPGVRVREVGRDDPDYLDVLTLGYSMKSASPEARRVFELEHSTPGLRRYLATVDGEPAAAAALFSHGGLSLFVGAATLPAFRRRGCQSALIHRRLADASETSDLVVATAAVNSASSENLERRGFAVTHLRTLWS